MLWFPEWILDFAPIGWSARRGPVWARQKRQQGFRRGIAVFGNEETWGCKLYMMLYIGACHRIESLSFLSTPEELRTVGLLCCKWLAHWVSTTALLSKCMTHLFVGECYCPLWCRILVQVEGKSVSAETVDNTCGDGSKPIITIFGETTIHYSSIKQIF